MKAFHFPLEQVRLWRHEQTEVEELKLQKVNGELNTYQALAQKVQAEANEAARTVLGRGRIESGELATLDGFREYSRTRLTQIGEQISHCRQRADEQRQRLIEARRQFELLDRLKRKAMAEWRIARDKEQDELAAELFLAKRARGRD